MRYRDNIEEYPGVSTLLVRIDGGRFRSGMGEGKFLFRVKESRPTRSGPSVTDTQDDTCRDVKD